MVSTENEMLAELREAFQRAEPHGVWRKLHGNRFQAGMPDLLVATSNRAALVEAKWVRTKADMRLPLAALVEKTLTGLQRAELRRLAALGGPLRARYLVGCRVEQPALLPGGEGCLVVGLDLSRLPHLLPTQTLDCFLEEAFRLYQFGLDQHYEMADVFKGPGTDYMVNFQVRCRGERWNVADLVLGNEPWSLEGENRGD